MPSPSTPYDFIIVLGNRPARDEHGLPAPEIRRRVRSGVDLFHQGVAPSLVMTGGPFAEGPESESEVMGQLARMWGVPSRALLLEKRSQSTAENARFSRSLLCGERSECEPRVVVVTNAFHTPRARRLFRCAGFLADSFVSPLPEPEHEKAQTWELLASFAGWFSDPCQLAGAE